MIQKILSATLLFLVPLQNFQVDSHEELISNADEAMSVLQKGEANRTVAETGMNETSSRSHSIFRMIVESHDNSENEEGDKVLIGELNLVDLAGSESALTAEVKGQRLQESKNINRSLSTLSRVINQLASGGKGQYISFRDSQLTKLLQGSLAGNSRISVICCVSPVGMETKSTLNFASSAKKISLSVSANEVVDDQTKIKQMQKELARLKKELERAKQGESTSNDTKNEQLFETLRKQVLVGGTLARDVRSARLARKGRQKRHRETWCPTITSGISLTGSGIFDRHAGKQRCVEVEESIMPFENPKAGKDEELETELCCGEKQNVVGDSRLSHTFELSVSVDAKNDENDSSRYEKLNQYRRKLEEELQEAQGSLAEANEAIVSKDKELQDKEEKLTAAMNERENIAKEKAEMQQQKETFQQQQRESQTHSTKIQTLEEELSKMRHELEDSKSNQESSEERAIFAERRLHALRSEYDDVVHKESEQRASMERLQEERNTFKKQCEDLREECVQYKQRNTEDRATIADLRQELDQAISAKDKLDKKYEEMSKKVNRLQHDLANSKSHCAEVQAKLDESTSESKQRESEMQWYQERVAKLEKVKLTTGQVRKLKKIKNERDELKNEVQQLREVNDQLRSSGNSSAATSSSADNGDRTSAEKLRQAEESLEDLQVKYHDALAAKETAETETAQVRKMLKQAEEHNQGSNNLLAAVTGSLAKITSMAIEYADEFGLFSVESGSPGIPNKESICEQVRNSFKNLATSAEFEFREDFTVESLKQLSDRLDYRNENVVCTSMDLLHVMLKSVSEGLQQTLNDRLRILETKHTLKEKVETLEQRVTEQTEECTRLQEEYYRNLDEQTESLRSELEECRSSLAQRDADVAKKDEAITELQDSQRKLSDKVQNMENSTTEMKTKLDEMYNEKTKLQKDLEETRETLRYKEEQLAQSRDEHRNGVKFLEQENLELMMEVRNLRQKLNSSQSEKQENITKAKSQPASSNFSSRNSENAGPWETTTGFSTSEDDVKQWYSSETTKETEVRTSTNDSTGETSGTNGSKVLAERDPNTEDDDDFGSLRSPGVAKHKAQGADQRESLARPRLDFAMNDDENTGECTHQ